MSELKPLRVEIFRDETTRKQSIDAAELGIDRLNRTVQGLVIVKTTRLFRIPVNSDGWVDTQKHVTWPFFEADLNIVLTERPISSGEQDNRFAKEPHDVAGIAHINNHVDGLRVAIVNTTTLLPETTVMHETGHLLNLKKRGSNHDGNGHCIHENCLMYPKNNFYMERTKRLVGRSALLRRKKYEMVDERLVGSAEQFCTECAQQAKVNTYMLQTAKSGVFVPTHLLG